MVYNYRLSQARMLVECAFGIMSQCFRCLSRKMYCSLDTAESMVKAVCVLHNYLLKQDNLAQDVQHDLYALGKKPHYTGNFKAFAPVQGYHSSQNVRQVCDIFAKYFMSSLGEVPWQYRCAHVAVLE